MLLCCGIFFFKQKTAYEMRISDWSSDVCSSDLSGITTPTEAAAVAAAYALLISVLLYRSVSFRDFYKSMLASARTSASIGMLIAGALEIGRASCRVRVCRYV